MIASALARRTRDIAGTVSLLPALLGGTPASGLERVTIGQGGELDWGGRGSAALVVIEPTHRSPLDPAKSLLVGNAPGDLLEFSSERYPGALHPLRIEEGTNIAPSSVKRGGSITAPNVFDFGTGAVGGQSIFDASDLRLQLEELLDDADGGETAAFERKYFNSLGVLIIADLGGSFGVDRIRFYPRNTVVSSPTTPFQNDFLRSFELYINDGKILTGSGSLIWQPLVLQPNNEEPVVDVRLSPPRPVEWLRIRSTTTTDFEIDEIEVFGVGFLREAQYISHLFDASQPAVWGDIGWREAVVGDSAFSRMTIRTRTGQDDTPFVFTRKLAGQANAEEIPFSLANPTQELTRKEYDSLPQLDALGRRWEKGKIRDDPATWSAWSTPLPVGAANGPWVPIPSPSPRQYLQLQVLFQSDELESARVLESLGFTFLTPPLADLVVGEVYPREVGLSEATTFTSALRAHNATGNGQGFDVVQIATPARVESIDAVEIQDRDGNKLGERQFSSLEDTTAIAGIRILSVAGDAFRVQVPTVREDGILVKVTYRATVLTYSTDFRTLVLNQSEPGATQDVEQGNAAVLGPDDDDDRSGTTVLSPAVLDHGALLDRVTFVPPVITPNGDGLNDVGRLEYNLLSLSRPRPVDILIYDLSRRLVRELFSGVESNGQYTDKTWDGLDEAGNLVPPGNYVVRIEVLGDSQTGEALRVVSVAY